MKFTYEEILEAIKRAREDEKSSEIMKAINDVVVDALESHIPIEVTKFIKNRTKDALGAGDCPKCKRLVVEPQEYCPHCGQRLYWGKEFE